MSEISYYDNIDEMPLYNWRKCQEKEEYNYCRITPKEGGDEESTELEDLKAWDKIYDSYIKEFGLGKDFERIMELRREIAELQCDFIIKDERYILNRIKRIQRELMDFLERPVDSDTDTILTHLRKWMGTWLDEKVMTVKDFYKMLREYEKEIESLKNVGNG